jgi:phosphate/sulfate permease
MDLTVFIFLLILLLAFANGTNDVSKAIATLVGSGIANLWDSYRLGNVLDNGRCLRFGLCRLCHGQNLQ